MKKFLKYGFFAALIAMFAIIYTTDVVAKDKKVEATSTLSMATAGAGMVRQRKQSVYAKLRSQFPASVYPVIEDSILKMEAVLVNGQNEYRFNHKISDNQSPTEIRLAEQDLFKIIDVGIFLQSEDDTAPSCSVLQTYPNPIVFPDEAGFVINKHLEHIYNGKLGVKVGDTVYSNGRLVNDCRVVRTAQQTSGANASENLTGDGFFPMQPQFAIKGREKVDFVLKVPASVLHKIQTASATKRNKVVLVLRGFTVSGAGATA